MKYFFRLVLIPITCTFSWGAWSFDENDLSYDDIVSELSGQQRAPILTRDPFADVLIHTGVGFASSYTSILLPQQNLSNQVLLSGFEASLGIDLFSRHWMAEGSIRSFDPTELSTRQTLSLKEFDLKAIYRENLSRRLGLRMGLGLAARYLTFSPSLQAPASTYSTPASLISTGLNARISRSFSLLAEVSYRRTLVSDTPDQSALQASLRLDGHF